MPDAPLAFTAADPALESLPQPRSHRRRVAALWPLGVVLVAIVSFQVAASIAKGLFPAVGAEGTTAYRGVISAVLLGAIWQPWRARPSRRGALVLLAYGVAMGVMNLSFYMSLRTLPLGIAVALEFTGPLAVAILSSRRLLDFAWVALAVAGLVPLLPFGTMLFGQAGAVDPTGAAYALGAGLCWALYIVFGQAAGAEHGGRTTAIGLVISCLVTAPIGLAHAGWRLFDPSLLPLAAIVAVLSSALPYQLEMVAMTRMPTRTFGISMSLEPAVGALSGLLLLGERLSLTEVAGIACVVLASVGSAATARASA